MHTQSVSRTSVKSGKMPRLSFIEALMYVTVEDAHFFCWMKQLISNREERNGPKLIAAEWIANEWEPEIACLIGGPESPKLPNWCQLEHYLIGKLCLCVCVWMSASCAWCANWCPFSSAVHLADDDDYDAWTICTTAVDWQFSHLAI